LARITSRTAVQVFEVVLSIRRLHARSVFGSQLLLSLDEIGRMVSLLVLLSIPSLSALIGIVAAITVQTLYPRLKERPRRVIAFPNNKVENGNLVQMGELEFEKGERQRPKLIRGAGAQRGYWSAR